MTKKIEKHVYKITDPTLTLTQLFVFNIIREDDEIALEDIHILINNGENDYKVVLDVQTIMEQIANNPKDSITSKKQDKILGEIFDDIVAQLDKPQKTEQDLKDAIRQRYPEYDKEREFDYEYVLYAMSKIEERQLTKNQDIVDQLLNKKP